MGLPGLFRGCVTKELVLDLLIKGSPLLAKGAAERIEDPVIRKRLLLACEGYLSVSREQPLDWPQTWEETKKLLQEAKDTCVSDFGGLSEFAEKEFNEYLAANEFELAWGVLYEHARSGSLFWDQIDALSERMGL
jgi:hypothetical protein